MLCCGLGSGRIGVSGVSSVGFRVGGGFGGGVCGGGLGGFGGGVGGVGGRDERRGLGGGSVDGAAATAGRAARRGCGVLLGILGLGVDDVGRVGGGQVRAYSWGFALNRGGGKGERFAVRSVTARVTMTV
jgi:hypothetical protein